MYVVANATTVLFSDAEEEERRVSFVRHRGFSDDDDGLFRCGGGGGILRAIERASIEIVHNGVCDCESDARARRSRGRRGREGKV